MTTPTTWRIHVGAHKTATTHLQDTLAAQRAELHANGVDFVPREAARARGLVKILRGSGWCRILPDALRRHVARSTLHALGCRGPVVAISDENLLGRPEDLLLSGCYPRASQRMRALGKLTAGELHLFLSVRDYATLLPSVYAQVLRARPLPGGFAPLRDRWLATPPSWADLARRIRSVVPAASLTVWTYERYATSPGEVLSAFTGFSDLRELSLPRPSRTRAPSAEAIARMEALDPGLSASDYARAVEVISSADPGVSVFQPLPQSDREALSASYEEDLAQMRIEGLQVLRG